MKNTIEFSARYGKKEKAAQVFSRILRWVMLASLIIFVISATTLHVLGYAAPSVHAICPYGGLESLLAFITFGAFVKKIFLGTFVIFFVTVGLAFVMRRSFCGQICAFGGLQEFFGKLGRKLFRKQPVLPRKLDKVLRYLKFVVLGITIVMAWVTAELWITPYDPFNALGHLADFNALMTTYLVGFIVLLVTLLGSVVYDRFFCKYLCPVGALYGAIGKASPYAVRINKEKCIRCGLCNKACPMNVDIMDAKKEKITDMECINCNECVTVCPSRGALHTGFGKRRILHPVLATLLALALFFVPIGVATAAGAMQLLPNRFLNYEAEDVHIETGDESEHIESDGVSGQLEAGDEEVHEEGGEESYTEINGYAPSDIKGSMTMQEVSDALQVPLSELYHKLELPEDYPAGNTIKTAALSKGMEFSVFKHALFE